MTGRLILGVLLIAIGGGGETCAAAELPPAGPSFSQEVAPLLAKHCLECHDGSTKEGRLDLSTHAGMRAGGKKGKAVVPGRPGESLAWKMVESGDMPEGRPPLSAGEKKLLHAWIEAGAIWPGGGAIDPLAHRRDRRATQAWLRRLTVPEYVETVRASVGIDIDAEARRMLPPDLRADGFRNTAYNLNVDLAHVEAYGRLAELIVGRVDVPAFAGRYSKERSTSDAAMRPLIETMGRSLLRGPLEGHEVEAFLGVARAVAKEGGDFKEAASCVLEAMLQSPRFVYRIERQVGDGSSTRVGPYELASRLSYVLWGGPPDAELMRAAAAGELSDRSRVEAQVARMLRDPRAVEQSKRFLEQWLDLDRLATLRPDRKRFPQWDAHLAADMRQETLTFFEEVAWRQNRPLADLLNAEVTFATPRLAAHYGLKRPNVPAGGKDRLEALFTFGEGKGGLMRDTSGAAGGGLELKAERASAVTWDAGGLTIDSVTTVATAQPPARLIEAIVKANALSVEAWITPADARQAGPARIVTISGGPSQRNFTLGQEADRFEVRLRTGRTDANGMPALASPPGLAQARPTHIVYTRDATGKARLYVDGQRVAEQEVGGDLAKWDRKFQLILGNESTKDRPWRGTFHRVAIYSRALAEDEVRSHGGGLSRYDLSSVPARGGLLTHGSVLTIGGDESSMVARGLFVLKDLLHSGVGSAPPGVDTTPKPTRPGVSQRVMAESRLADSSCMGCHAKFEPLAFGLEQFDAIGRHREKDHHGNRLRDDGEILFPGAAKAVSYKSSAELMDLLAGSDRVRMTFTRKLTQFALGRPLVESDAPAVEAIHSVAMKNGGTYASLISAIVMSDLVQTTTTETTTETKQ